jgi:hypothetical protein
VISGICLIPRGTLHEQLEYPLIKPLAECVAYDRFVNVSISYPFSPGGDFAVCLHHSALVDCAGGSTYVAVVAFPAPEITRLFPRVTPIDSIVFDAVINSMLSRTVGRTVGTSLFTPTNGYDSLSERLLRPPPGWLDEFEGAVATLPKEEQRIIGLLYGPDEPSDITYRAEQRPRLVRAPIVHLYLDISGSMTACLPYL